MCNFKYPVTVESNEEGGYIASFRDVPEALTEGWTLEEVKQNALDALITSIEFYIEDNRPFPKPSPVADNEEYIALPASVVSKILLLNAMAEQKVRPVDLARKMNIKPQEVNRIIDLKHNSKIDTIEKALHALGFDLSFNCIRI